jgi:hypothetical protein
MPEGRPRKETPPNGGVIGVPEKAVLSVRESAEGMGVAPRTVGKAKSGASLSAPAMSNLPQGRPADKGANLPLLPEAPEAPAVSVAAAAEMLSVSERSVATSKPVLLADVEEALA